MIQHKAPHRNWMPDIKNVNKFDNVTIPVPDNFFDDYATRAAHEQEMEIAKKLTINSGLSKNTIVVFTSDQEFYLGEHGWFDKRFMYEESLKTPLLIKYPNHISKEWVCDKMV